VALRLRFSTDLPFSNRKADFMLTLFAGARMPKFILRRSSGQPIALLSAYRFAFHW
jgi:hypothetical protein